MSLVAHGKTTVVLVGSDTQEASLAHLLPHFIGELIAVVDVLGDFLRNLSSCKLNRAFSQLVQIVLRRRGESLWVLGRGMSLLVELCGEKASFGG